MMQHAQQNKVDAQRQSATERISTINRKLDGAERVLSHEKAPIQDWAARYDMWSSWEDVEELGEALTGEQTKLEALKEGSSFMGHYHDHSEGER